MSQIGSRDHDLITLNQGKSPIYLISNRAYLYDGPHITIDIETTVTDCVIITVHSGYMSITFSILFLFVLYTENSVQ